MLFSLYGINKLKKELARADSSNYNGIDDLLKIGKNQYTKGEGIVIAYIDGSFSRCSCANKQYISEYGIFKDGKSVGRFKVSAIGEYFKKNSFNRCKWTYENYKVMYYLEKFISSRSDIKIVDTVYNVQPSTII